MDLVSLLVTASLPQNGDVKIGSKICSISHCSEEFESFEICNTCEISSFSHIVMLVVELSKLNDGSELQRDPETCTAGQRK